MRERGALATAEEGTREERVAERASVELAGEARAARAQSKGSALAFLFCDEVVDESLCFPGGRYPPSVSLGAHV